MNTGIFGSTAKLQELAAQTLTTCVDKALDDPALISAAGQIPAAHSGNGSADQRLSELKQLFDNGLVSEGEYQTKRTAILNGL